MADSDGPVNLTTTLMHPEQEFITRGAILAGKSFAPWSHDQVQSLVNWQEAGYVHPYDCGGPNCSGISLTPRPEGLRCPQCGMLQKWCLNMSLGTVPPHPFADWTDPGPDD